MSLFASFSSVPFIPDSRANSIEKHLVTTDMTHRPRQYLYLCGPDEAAEQVLASFANLCHLDNMSVRYAKQFTHRIRFEEGVTKNVLRLVELLESALTLTPRPELDFAVVLDWYKVPPNEDSDRWTNTDTGELVYRAKYYNAGRDSRTAREELVRQMTETIQQHPLLSYADQLITCPGHQADGASFGEWLATEISKSLGMPLVPTTCLTGARASRKEGPIDLTGAFGFPEGLTGRCLIIDDVYQSGTTMGAVATAARTAGASNVFGFAPVRTMKR